MAPHVALRVSRELHKLEAVRLALTAAEGQLESACLLTDEGRPRPAHIAASSAAQSVERALTLLSEAYAALDKIAEEA